MLTRSDISRNVVATVCAWLMLMPPASLARPVEPAEPKPIPTLEAPQNEPQPVMGEPLVVTVGKSLVIDSPVPIKRLSTANGALVDANAISPKEILLNAKAPGETSLLIWREDGSRLIYDLIVRISPRQLNAVRDQIAREYPEADINVTFDNDTAFVRGTVKDLTMADRIIAMVTTLGKTVNLMKVEVPPVEPQILLKVRFANVDRAASQQLGVNFASTAFNQTTALGTSSSLLSSVAGGLASAAVGAGVNIFAVRPDINLMAQIQALESKNLLETLAEPNLLTFSGTRANFTAGGEVPIPVVQPTQGSSTLSVEFKEYGVRLSFLPRVTPQGTIHMQVNPEVSALDYAHGVSFGGYTIPGTTVRKVTTEVDLESGQTFIVAGLLDRQITETLSKIPGLGDIPILGKLFQSRTINKNNSELMIIITPEIVRPIAGNQPVSDLKWTVPFMSNNSDFPMRHPGMDVTGAVPTHPPSATMPMEQLIQQQKLVQAAPITVPGAAQSGPPTANPQPPAAPPAGGGGGGGKQ